MTTFRAHLISAFLTERGIISSSIFELLEDVLTEFYSGMF